MSHHLFGQLFIADSYAVVYIMNLEPLAEFYSLFPAEEMSSKRRKLTQSTSPPVNTVSTLNTKVTLYVHLVVFR